MEKRIAIVLACLLLAAVAVARADRQQITPILSPLSTFPVDLAGWQSRDLPPLSDRELEVLGADDYLTRAYYTRQGSIGLFVGFWESQQQGDTIHSPLNCLPGAGWEPMATGFLSVGDPRNPSGPPMTVNRVVIQKGLDKQLVLYWYQSHGRVVASEYWGKIYMVLDAMRLNRTDGAIVRVIAPVMGDTAEAEAEAERAALSFIDDLLPELDRHLPA